MTLLTDNQSTCFDALMKQGVGKWKGNRIYESVKTGKVTKVSNAFDITLNETDQQMLEDLHDLPHGTFPYLVRVSWTSYDTDTQKLLSEGSMLMGYHDGWLYRDKGYVTDKPVASRVEMPSPDHMLIRTFYEGITTLGDETVAYEENFRWAGERRLRTVLAWDKEHQLTLMGQYMEYKLAA
jgi:CpeS-like protein